MMVYKRLLISIIVRIVLITLTISAIIYFWMGNRDYLILLNLLAFLILQVFLFIRSQNQVNRKLKVFFEGFKFDDLGFKTSDEFTNRSFRDLYSAMHGISEHVKQINLETQQEKQYFQSVTEHAGVGILACNEKKEVKLANLTVKEMLGIGELNTLSDLNTIRDDLPGKLDKIKPGEQVLIKLNVQDQADIMGENRLLLSVRCTEIKHKKESIRVLTFQNIRSELEENELESWQKVIRVITHEITNSTGPISSAAQTMLELLEQDETDKKESPGIAPGIKDDLLEGLKIIRERSTGMEKFSQQFRQVTLMPQPNREKIQVDELLNGISVLFEKRLKEGGIDYALNTETPGMFFFADRNLVDQAMINLMNNAIEALDSSSHKSIRVEVRSLPGKQCVISIIDSGKGITNEEMDTIFIPFYTSREGGSGIGLSLVRNIMRMHRGSLNVSSEPGEQTTFSMIF